MKTKFNLEPKSVRIFVSLTFTILLVTLAQVNLKAQGSLIITNNTNCDFVVKQLVYSTRNTTGGNTNPNLTVYGNTTTTPPDLDFGTDSSDLLSVIVDPNTPGLGDQHIDCEQDRMICLCGYICYADITCTQSSAPSTPANITITINYANTPPEPCN